MTERVEPELGSIWLFFDWFWFKFWFWFKLWFKGSNLVMEAEVARLLRLADTLQVGFSSQSEFHHPHEHFDDTNNIMKTIFDVGAKAIHNSVTRITQNSVFQKVQKFHEH